MHIRVKKIYSRKTKSNINSKHMEERRKDENKVNELNSFFLSNYLIFSLSVPESMFICKHCLIKQLISRRFKVKNC